MFNRHYHILIATVLNGLNVKFLSRTCSRLGGGTALTMRYGEYRTSRDTVFLCPVRPGYRELRRALQLEGVQSLVGNREAVVITRGPKIDQYGVRLAVRTPDMADDEPALKLEIIAEARIGFGASDFLDRTRVPCMNLTDSVAEKLLSNADRWADRAVECRDLIDLCVLRRHQPFPRKAYEKAENAYPVIPPLESALHGFRDDVRLREHCFTALEIHDRAPIMDGLDQLCADFGMEPAQRSTVEESPRQHRPPPTFN